MATVHRAAATHTRFAPQRASPWDWQPLVATKVEFGPVYDRFYLDRTETGSSGRFIPLKSQLYRDAPKYWRRHRVDPRFVEISTIGRLSQDLVGISPQWASIGTVAKAAERLGFGMIIEDFIVPGWMVDPDDIERIMPEIEVCGSIWNAAGWALSFHWQQASKPDWMSDCRIDWRLAKEMFEKAAALDYWAAANNLGVIFRDGLGQPTEPKQSLHWFTIAAESLEPISLRHLAGCYSAGFGTEKDAEYATYLEELAQMIECEKT